MIVWIASYPRSGNTFFRILLNRMCDIKTYSIYDDRIFEDNKEVGDVVGHHHMDMSVAQMAESSTRYFIKTHELPSDDAPAIYLVRDGRDTLVSYAHYILNFESTAEGRHDQAAFLDTLRQLVVDRGSFGGWGPHVLAWTQARPSTAAVVKFESLIRDPQAALSDSLASFNGTARSVQAPGLAHVPGVVPSFEELRHLFPQFFRKGQVGGWRDEMPPDVEQLVWEHYGEAMSAMGYM